MTASKKNSPSHQPVHNPLERISLRATKWIGSAPSLVLHTVIFIICFILPVFGIPFSTILLVLTTIVSLEAIYLSILIQISVNRQDAQLKEVSEDVEEIHENVEEMQEDVEEIQKDVDEIQEDVEEIQEDVDEIQEDVEEINEEEDEEPEGKAMPVDQGTLERIEFALKELGKEIAELKRHSK